jgi:predicted O-methyltransferase YrrM
MHSKMANQTNQLNIKMQEWLQLHASNPSEAMVQLCKQTQSLEDAEMLTSLEQLQFLSFLATSINAKKAIEVGVYTGASALAVAEVLPTDGGLIACDSTDEYLPIAKPAWEQGGVAKKIEVKVGPALETLQTLLDEGYANTFDFMYIDADKTNSKNYFEFGIQLIRCGGMITIDNMFYGGYVADETQQDENTQATRDLAKHLIQDDRITYALIPIGDGLATCIVNTA